MVDPTEVPQGLACGCICAGCKTVLVAKKGTSKVAHFAHQSACAAAYETSIHLAAKQILLELGYAWLPESLAGPVSRYRWARIEIEAALSDLRPDALAYSPEGEKLAIEIFVTHAVDDPKREIIRKQQLLTVEYDLSDLPRDIAYNHLKHSFAEGLVRSRWIYNRKIDEIAEAMKAQAEATRLAAKQKNVPGLSHVIMPAPNKNAKTWSITALVSNGPSRHPVDHCPVANAQVNENAFIPDAGTDCPRCPFFGGSIRSGTNIVLSCAGHYAAGTLPKEETEKWRTLFKRLTWRSDPINPEASPNAAGR